MGDDSHFGDSGRRDLHEGEMMKEKIIGWINAGGKKVQEFISDQDPMHVMIVIGCVVFAVVLWAIT